MGGELELPSWDGHSGYLDLLGQRPPSLNVAVLAGHGTLRLATLGGARRPAGDDEVARMSELVEEAVAAGAVGLSTGLIYEPARHAPTEEIAALARVMSGTGRLYVTHMRNESVRLVQSVEEGSGCCGRLSIWWFAVSLGWSCWRCARRGRRISRFWCCGTS